MTDKELGTRPFAAGQSGLWSSLLKVISVKVMPPKIYSCHTEPDCTFITLVSSYHNLKNEICGTNCFIPLCLSVFSVLQMNFGRNSFEFPATLPKFRAHNLKGDDFWAT